MSEEGLICPLCSRALSVEAPVCPNDHGIEVRGVPPSEVERTPRSKRHLLGVTVSDIYVINGYLGSGGFGAVYKAHQTTVGRDVALKLLTTDAVVDPAVLERFRREARTAAALLDPNVVTIFDFGETRLSDEVEDHALWIAMELVVGPTLKAVLEVEGGLGLEGAVFTGVNILRGLAAAHRQGVVHRDLKPGNVLIDENNGRPYFARLFDFGIASLQGSGGHTMNVGDGGVLGTPKYMAPEQWRATRTTPATDVYAFGIMLAEMLLGVAPIPKMEMMQMAAAHCRGPRPSVQWTGTGEPVPEALTALIETCTAIDPDLRFPSARQALVALEDIAALFDGRGRPSARPPSASGEWRVGGSASGVSSDGLLERFAGPDSTPFGAPFAVADDPGPFDPAGHDSDSSGSARHDSGAFGSGAFGSASDSSVGGSGSFDGPPPPTRDNSGVIDMFDPSRSIDVFDPATNRPTPAPAARSAEIPPPLADDDTMVVAEPLPEGSLDVLLRDPHRLPPTEPLGASSSGDTRPPAGSTSGLVPAFGARSRPVRGLLPPPGSARPGPAIPPPFGSIDTSVAGLDRGAPVLARSSLGSVRSGRSSLDRLGPSGSLEASVDSASLPPMVTFDSVPPDAVSSPPADVEATAPATRARPAEVSAPPRRPIAGIGGSVPGPPTDEDVVPIPGGRLSTAPPAAVVAERTTAPGSPRHTPPARRRALWPWTAAALAVLLALLAVRWVTEPAVVDDPAPAPPTVGELSSAADAPRDPPSPPSMAADDRAPVDAAAARAVDAGPPTVAAAGAHKVLSGQQNPLPELAPVKPKPAPVKPKPEPVKPKPEPVQPAPVRPKPAPVRPKPAPVRPKPALAQPAPAPPPQPRAPSAAEAQYALGVDAMRRGALNAAQGYFTRALGEGLDGAKASDARRRIKEIADKGGLEDDF